MLYERLYDLPCDLIGVSDSMLVANELQEELDGCVAQWYLARQAFDMAEASGRRRRVLLDLFERRLIGRYLRVDSAPGLEQLAALSRSPTGQTGQTGTDEEHGVGLRCRCRCIALIYEGHVVADSRKNSTGLEELQGERVDHLGPVSTWRTVKSEPLNEAFPIMEEGFGAKIGGLSGRHALLVREPGDFIFRLELKVD